MSNERKKSKESKREPENCREGGKKDGREHKVRKQGKERARNRRGERKEGEGKGRTKEGREKGREVKTK